MSSPQLTESIIRAGANSQIYQRGYALWQAGAISNTALQGDVLMGECEGTSAPYYTLRIELDAGGIRSAYCSCPYEFGGYCKHAVALLLAYIHAPQQFIKRKPASELLADLDRETLIALLTKLLHDRPELSDWVEAAISTPSGKTKKGKRKAVDAEVYRREIHNIIHSLDRLRSSEAYWHVGGLVNELQEVEANAVKFLDAGDADTALAILLALIEEASDGYESIDDSDGEFGGYLSDVGQPLAEAILSLELSAVERQRLNDRLKKYDRHLSDYGIDGALDVALEALEFGWETPPRRSSPAVNAEDWDNEEEDQSADYDNDSDTDLYEDAGASGWSTYQPGDLTEAKLNVLQRQKRVDEYLALCQAAHRHLRYALKLCELDRVAEAVKFAHEQLTTTSEALQLAQRLRTLNQLAEALAIGERGLKLNGPKRSLAEWLAPIEEAQGRKSHALEAWLAAFHEDPHLEIYKTIQQLAGSKWAALRSDLMAVLRKCYSKLPLAQVLLFEEAWSDAMQLADQPNVEYAVVEIVADAVVQRQPDWVMRVGVKHAERLMVEPKSSHYPIAAAWLKRAKKAYLQAGQKMEWEKYLAGIKEQYKRRPALQTHLRQL
jgi:uncharacterized Zn finger protein